MGRKVTIRGSKFTLKEKRFFLGKIPYWKKIFSSTSIDEVRNRILQKIDLQ